MISKIVKSFKDFKRSDSRLVELIQYYSIFNKSSSASLIKDEVMFKLLDKEKKGTLSNTSIIKIC